MEGSGKSQVEGKQSKERGIGKEERGREKREGEKRERTGKEKRERERVCVCVIMLVEYYSCVRGWMDPLDGWTPGPSVIQQDKWTPWVYVLGWMDSHMDG